MSTNRKYFKQSKEERQYRRFSPSFKMKKVREIEQGKVRISEICKAYEVSDTSVYGWLKKYGTMKKPERTVVESKSDSGKIVDLERRIAELERMLGQKQLEIEFKDKMIDLAEKTYNIDIKKKSKTK